MKAHTIWMFLSLVLAIIAGQWLSNRFILRGPVEETKKEVASSGDPIKDFLDNF